MPASLLGTEEAEVLLWAPRGQGLFPIRGGGAPEVKEIGFPHHDTDSYLMGNSTRARWPERDTAPLESNVLTVAQGDTLTG